MKFYPYEKGVAEKVLAMLKRGHSFGVVFTLYLEVLAILKGEGGSKKFPLFKRGWRKKFYHEFYHVLRAGEWGGGGHKKFRTRNFPFL